MADREKVIKNIKRGGSVMMYVGTASMIRPAVAKAREDQNGAVQACAIFGGTMLTLGIARKATQWMNQAIDRVVDFYDDVKPKKKKEEEKADEVKKDG